MDWVPVNEPGVTRRGLGDLPCFRKTGRPDDVLDILTSQREVRVATWPPSSHTWLFWALVRACRRAEAQANIRRSEQDGDAPTSESGSAL